MLIRLELSKLLLELQILYPQFLAPHLKHVVVNSRLFIFFPRSILVVQRSETSPSIFFVAAFSVFNVIQSLVIFMSRTLMALSFSLYLSKVVSLSSTTLAFTMWDSSAHPTLSQSPYAKLCQLQQTWHVNLCQYDTTSYVDSKRKSRSAWRMF